MHEPRVPRRQPDEVFLADDEALALRDRRTGQDRAVTGVDAVWLAARWERPEMLAVEQDFGSR